MASYFPNIGSWYKDNETGQRFEIVAIDEKQKTIEIQYYDGDISEFDIESWGSLKITETETPEESYAGFDGFAAYGNETNTENSFINSSNPLDSFEPESFHGFDDLY